LYLPGAVQLVVVPSVGCAYVSWRSVAPPAP
jgi:hypothetical protein